MSLRAEFVTLAAQEGANLRQLCRRFGISPRTGYKWLRRYQQEGRAGLQDRSRRPHTSPRRSPPRVEQAVLAERHQHPAWGGRKLRRRLERQPAFGGTRLPSAGTITAILRRHDQLSSPAAAPHAWQRFEHPAPNLLWQMDFKGHFAIGGGQRGHPLTVLDDHSRFCVGLVACADEQGHTVQTSLVPIFERYGLPQRLLMDNGPPWGNTRDQDLTPLVVWLLRLGTDVVHSRPYHPQTGGKDERFHRTLKAELLRDREFADLAHCQREFDPWRAMYNLDRPHQALGLEVPANRYQVSPRPYPAVLPPVEACYGPDDLIRKVQHGGAISVHGRTYRLPKALRGYPVALRPTAEADQWQVFFCQHKVVILDLRQPRD